MLYQLSYFRSLSRNGTSVEKENETMYPERDLNPHSR
ncbi:hypothetical protein PGN_1439 [Porphyromonas gingivalis ATCC 33277]|uniref:Uncharacterized protein n=1 Tax=Porphyromonas gingivalis (strain ATCC 33277 / DSM 20709 / CIP 103683 / JCM 12257 / NCTC 11834 / 2561) TaxID=431947 RepID=B2RKR3_PORG3|nr:hypothetical protein PGN_1439 [Porphyromonas gingivalis ATCC 33277]